jgi:YVTN family beta-propeller protein
MKTIILAALSSVFLLHTYAQPDYKNDRVYTANQVSNTISVIDPSTDKLLGEISLGKPYPNVLSALYRGQSLVHGLRYDAKRKMLAAVAIGSNAVILISTENNQILKTIYVGRSPHEPTFTPNDKQIWVSVRGEAYVSVIDIDLMKEIKQIPVADGPGMISFSPDGKIAYVCSSFTPELDMVDTKSYQIIKRISVVSPFCPNIFTSPKGEWVAMTHKDVGAVTVLNTTTQTIAKVISTGAITNHVTFNYINNKLMMLVTVGGENKVRVFDVADDFKQTDSINVDAMPHGIWPSADGKQLYIGLEFSDEVQHIDLQKMKVISTIKIGQSPQALVYADNAVTNGDGKEGLVALNDTTATQVLTMQPADETITANGKLAIRTIGLIDLVEQLFKGLKANTAYTLFLSKSNAARYNDDFEINNFKTDGQGKYAGQSTGLVKHTNGDLSNAYNHVVLIETDSKQTILLK